MKYTFMQRMGLAFLVAMGAQIIAVPHIQQIQVTQQTGNSCGYHAVYNAQAVETLALYGEQIAAAAVMQEARQYRNLIQRDALLGDTIIDLASGLGIGNLYCINGRNGLTFAGACQGSQDGYLFLNDVAAEGYHNYPMIGHFIVNTGGHWVVFSVVKQPGQEATIIYMDSMNTPLSRNRTAQIVGNALLARLGVAVAPNHDAPGVSRGSGRQQRGRANGNFNNVQRNSGRQGNRPTNNPRQEDYEQESYEQEYAEQQESKVRKPRKHEGFSYQAYITVGLICLMIGFSFSR